MCMQEVALELKCERHARVCWSVCAYLTKKPFRSHPHLPGIRSEDEFPPLQSLQNRPCRDRVGQAVARLKRQA